MLCLLDSLHMRASHMVASFWLLTSGSAITDAPFSCSGKSSSCILVLGEGCSRKVKKARNFQHHMMEMKPLWRFSSSVNYLQHLCLLVILKNWCSLCNPGPKPTKITLCYVVSRAETTLCHHQVGKIDQGTTEDKLKTKNIIRLACVNP